MTHDHKLDGLQTLYLWALLGHGGGQWLDALKPVLPAPRRRQLRDWGLIGEAKRPAPTGSKKLFIELTEQGWIWSRQHLDAPVSDRSPAGNAILHNWLRRLKIYCDGQNVPLPELLAFQPPADAESPPAAKPLSTAKSAETGQNLAWTAIREAARALRGSDGRVRIAILAWAISRPPFAGLKAALVEAARQDRITLYPEEYPPNLSSEDRACAVHYGARDNHWFVLNG